MVRPVPYKGDEPYIFISYAHKDADLVWPIVARMQQDGYRVWYDEGIDPGTEWDENIADHVHGCAFFIAFLSENYLASDNCKDELNYARDENKPRLLVRLEQVELPTGMAMRLGRTESVAWDGTDPEGFYSSLYDAHRRVNAEGAQPPQSPKKGKAKWVVLLVPVLLALAAALLLLLGRGEKEPALPVSSGDESVTSGEEELAVSDNVVLLDNERTKVVALGLGADDSRRAGIRLSIENKTEDILVLWVNDCYINGAKCYESNTTNSAFSQSFSVPAGQILLEELLFERVVLDEYGIDTITVVELRLLDELRDGRDNVVEYGEYHDVVYYPYGQEAAEWAVYVPDEDDLVVYEDEACLIAVDGWEYGAADENGDYRNWRLDLMVVNRTGEKREFINRKSRVNGYFDYGWGGNVALRGGRMGRMKIYLFNYQDTGFDEVLKYVGEILTESATSGQETPLTEFTLYPGGDERVVLPGEVLAQGLVIENEQVRVRYLGSTYGSDNPYAWVLVENLSDVELNVDIDLTVEGTVYEAGAYALAPGESEEMDFYLYEQEGGDFLFPGQVTLAVRAEPHNWDGSEPFEAEVSAGLE